MPSSMEANVRGSPNDTSNTVAFANTTKGGDRPLENELGKASMHTGTPDEDLSTLLRKTMRMSTLLDTTNKPERVFSYHEYNDKVRRENLYKQAVGSEHFLSLDNSNRTSKLISDFTLAKINEKPVIPQGHTSVELGNVGGDAQPVRWYRSRRFIYSIIAVVILLVIIIPVATLA